MNAFLKVKTQTLAAEARIIRNLERSRKRQLRKAKERGVATFASDQLAANLYSHRIHIVRPAARCHHLALGFLRGRDYETMEQFAYSPPNWSEIEKLAVRFSREDERITQQKFASWLEQAKAASADYRETIKRRAKEEREAA